MKKRILSLYEHIKRRKISEPKTAFLGFGSTNREIAKILLDGCEDFNFTVRCDSGKCENDGIRVRGAEFITGESAFSNIDDDIIFASPSVRRDKLNFSVNGKHFLTSDTELFFQKTPKNTFLITGSSGKSTVTAITSALLYEKFPDIFTGGNIGTPIACSNLRKNSAFVLELSSFSLMYIEPRSKRATVTNISENHLNWHKDFGEYIECKLKILTNTDEAVLNADDGFFKHYLGGAFALTSEKLTAAEIAKKYHPEHCVTAEGGMLMLDGKKAVNISDIRLPGKFNIQNFMTAVAMSADHSDHWHIEYVARTFSGLSHRCEKFLVHENVSFIDSSIDTTPERTAQTLCALGENISVILGGCGKGLDLNPLKTPLKNKVKRISLYGGEGERIKDLIDSDAELSRIPHRHFDNFSDAAEYSAVKDADIDTVLLSPAATAYGEFKNFSERGDTFKKIIREKFGR